MQKVKRGERVREMERVYVCVCMCVCVCVCLRVRETVVTVKEKRCHAVFLDSDLNGGQWTMDNGGTEDSRLLRISSRTKGVTGLEWNKGLV